LSTEIIVLRAFMADQERAEELLAHGFAPALMTTREGRQVAETLLALRRGGTVPSLENLRRALDQRGRLGGGFRQYMTWLERMPCCSRLHAVAHLQLLKLDQVLARVDKVCERITAQGEAGATEMSTNQGPGQASSVPKHGPGGTDRRGAGQQRPASLRGIDEGEQGEDGLRAVSG